LHRGVYERFIRDYCEGRGVPLTVTTTVDSPAGSGLGSSSALVVALVEAFCAMFQVPLGRYDLAKLAFQIERIDLALPGGRQDQYAAAFGGVNFIEFLQGDRVIVNPLRVPTAALYEIETSLVICFSGQSRQSEEIIRMQISGIAEKRERTMEAMHRLKADAFEMKAALLAGDVETMARILGHSWTAKKDTAEGITNPRMEHLYETALAAGAMAGKVSGAGGGGMMMFLVMPENRVQLINALNREGGVASPVKFTYGGTESWTPMRRRS
jgi:D-glycero-alpha-D-manno-heptose-7-phosphate kinase